jgi:RNA polymerase sigma factor (TIGR02999 family)
VDERRAVTNLLIAWQGGDQAAFDQLSPYVYRELRRLASRAMRKEPAGHTLQTTALVHEAFIRLVDADVDYASRHHFMALAARLMRRILVDHARGKQRGKRGGGTPVLSLDPGAAEPEDPTDPIAVIELDDALTKLAEREPRLAEVVELIYFGGLSYEETAAALGISRTAVFEDLKFAKVWLRQAMS